MLPGKYFCFVFEIYYLLLSTDLLAAETVRLDLLDMSHNLIMAIDEEALTGKERFYRLITLGSSQPSSDCQNNSRIISL